MGLQEWGEEGAKSRKARVEVACCGSECDIQIHVLTRTLSSHAAFAFTVSVQEECLDAGRYKYNDVEIAVSDCGFATGL